MDLPQARTLLQRINRVFEDLGDGAKPPSSLERDLLREYVRRFYESLAEDAAADHRSGAKEAERTAPPSRDGNTNAQPARRPLAGRALRSESATSRAPFTFDAPAAPPAPLAPPPTGQAGGPPPATRKRSSVPTSPPAVSDDSSSPPIIEVPPVVEADVRRIESDAARDAEVPSPAAASPFVQDRPSNGTLPVAELEPALRELFTVERGQDLSERLANAPVADLTRAFALNERLVAQNQLFGKDAAALRDMLQRLDGLGSFEEAVAALVPTARRQEWTADERRAAAQSFVRLVRRRYPEQ